MHSPTQILHVIVCSARKLEASATPWSTLAELPARLSARDSPGGRTGNKCGIRCTCCTSHHLNLAVGYCNDWPAPLKRPLAALDLRLHLYKMKEHKMLWTICVVLLVLWALGMASAYTASGLIHILLVIALIVMVIRLIQGRRLSG